MEEGEGLLSGYEFGERSMVHLFCGVCGTAVMGRRHGLPEGEGVGINVSAVSAVREGLRVGMWVNVSWSFEEEACGRGVSERADDGIGEYVDGR